MTVTHPPGEPRRSSFAKLVIAGTAIVLTGLAGLTWTVTHCAPIGSSVPTFVRLKSDGTLQIAGGIDGAMMAAVAKALDDAKAPVRRVQLASPGGQEAAMEELAQLLVPLHATTEVPEGKTCQSACVGLLALSSGPVIVAPTATLIFHSGARRVGLAGSGICGCLNRVTVWLGGHVIPDTTPVMLPWAQALNDKLPALFAACEQDPLRTPDGMTLSGAELNGLRDGTIPPEALLRHCPKA